MSGDVPARRMAELGRRERIDELAAMLARAVKEHNYAEQVAILRKLLGA